MHVHMCSHIVLIFVSGGFFKYRGFFLSGSFFFQGVFSDRGFFLSGSFFFQAAFLSIGSFFFQGAFLSIGDFFSTWIFSFREFFRSLKKNFD